MKLTDLLVVYWREQVDDATSGKQQETKEDAQLEREAASRPHERPEKDDFLFESDPGRLPRGFNDRPHEMTVQAQERLTNIKSMRWFFFHKYLINY